MSSPLAVKRRRLNDPPSNLNKPFVSPLRRPKPVQKQPNESDAKVSGSYTPSTLAHSVPFPSDTGEHVNRIIRPNANKPFGRPELSSPRLGVSILKGNRTDPEELAVSRTVTQLELKLKRLQNDIDALEQCNALLSSDKDSDLDKLTGRWRKAAQEAAEELLGSAKERVDRMGGAQAWRDSERRKHDRAHGLGEFAPDQTKQQDDDKDCEFDSQGEELPEDEQEYRKSEKRRVRQEIMDAMDDVGDGHLEDESAREKFWQVPGMDDDEFTMEMMLRSLNIELDAIGYDRVSQRWES